LHVFHCPAPFSEHTKDRLKNKVVVCVQCTFAAKQKEGPENSIGAKASCIASGPEQLAGADV